MRSFGRGGSASMLGDNERAAGTAAGADIPYETWKSCKEETCNRACPMSDCMWPRTTVAMCGLYSWRPMSAAKLQATGHAAIIQLQRRRHPSGQGAPATERRARSPPTSQRPLSRCNVSKCANGPNHGRARLKPHHVRPRTAAWPNAGQRTRAGA